MAQFEKRVAMPSRSIIFADAGGVSNSAETNADNWQEIPATGCVYFRSPSDLAAYPSGDARAVPGIPGASTPRFSTAML